MKQICETLDRLFAIEVRGIGVPPWSGITYKLYDAARGENPITFEMACILQKAKGKKIAITTGSPVPDRYPLGENDGPLGAIVLGRSLILSGYSVIFYTEEEIQPFLRGLAQMFQLNIDIAGLGKSKDDQHAHLAKEVDMLITIEKAGGNESGHLHSIRGASHDGKRANIDGWVQRMKGMGKSVLSVGDGGNEIGFGNIYEKANEIIPNARKCHCPCGGSIISYQRADHLLPASTSNWGAYAITAAFALAQERTELFIHASDEIKMLELATQMGVKDGSTSHLGMTIDGIPAQTSAAIVEIFREVIEKALTRI